MIRSFFPVGQGAFYREKFELDNSSAQIVYDCGSSSNITYVKNAIYQYFRQGDKIDGLFISHFDSDHINGVETLLSHCVVKNIFIPLVSTQDRVILQLSHLMVKNSSKDDFAYNFISDPLSTIHDINTENETTLWDIRPTNPEENKERDWPEYQEVTRSLTSGDDVSSYVFSDQLNKGKFFNWKFIPYNFRQNERLKEFRKHLKAEFGIKGSPSDLEQLLRDFAKNKKRIKDVYKKVKGSINSNSLILFSGIEDPSIKQIESRVAIEKKEHTDKDFCPYRNDGSKICFSHKDFCDNYYMKTNACLYFGDYELKGVSAWEALYSKYKNYWQHLGCIQVPHHGSIHNYNSNLSDINAHFIASAGIHNQYKHPNVDVVNDLKQRQHKLKIVTEDASTLEEFIIE